MKTTDWKFDFSSLPRWNNRESIPYVYDEFFEISQNDTLCCIYSIAEVSMCNNLGFLAIVKNKEKPELFLNISEGFCFYPKVFVSKDGNLIFLQPSIFNQHTNTAVIPSLIIDLSKHAFAYFEFDNHTPYFEIVEVKRNIFKIVDEPQQNKIRKRLRSLIGRKIRINSLKWYDISKLVSLPEMLL